MKPRPERRQTFKVFHIQASQDPRKFHINGHETGTNRTSRTKTPVFTRVPLVVVTGIEPDTPRFSDPRQIKAKPPRWQVFTEIYGLLSFS